GMSWRGIWAVTALLHGLTVAACYALFRVWVSSPFAAAGAAFMCVSPIVLVQLANIRDYSKVPFFVAALALTAVVAVRPLQRRARIAASAAAGAIVGIGFGFRTDLIVVVPLFVASVALFAGHRPWTGLADNARAVAAFLLAAIITSAPILLRVSGGGSNPYHVFLLGYTDPYRATLRLNVPPYDMGLTYSDQYVEAA